MTAGSLALVALGRVVTLADGSHKLLTWILWPTVMMGLAVLALILWRAAHRPKYEGEETPPPAVNNRVDAAQTSGDHSTALQFQHSKVTINAPSSAGTGEPNAEITFDRALANALTELDSLARRLQRAEESGHLAPLPADHHQPLADLLTDKGLHSSRDALDAAYNACDALQHRLQEPSRRWEEGPMPEMKMPVVEGADDVLAVLVAVTAAVAKLRGLQGSSPQRDAAELQFGSVEVADPRQINEPNAFQENWQGCPVTFNLVNSQGGTRARAVRPTVTVTDPDGNVLAGSANARWANPQPSNSEEIERDIPANGAPVAIDTVIQPIGGEKFWLITDEGLRKGLKGGTAAIEAHDIRVTVSVQGENVPPATETVRVRLGFPKPALGDEEPSDTLLPPLEGDEKTAEASGEEEAPEEALELEPSRQPRTLRPRTQGGLDQLYVEGSRMLKAADPITSVVGSFLYGPAPTEAQVDRWQARVRETLPQSYRRRFRFAPLEARAAMPSVIQVIKPFENEKTRRLRESLDELKRIMADMDDE